MTWHERKRVAVQVAKGCVRGHSACTGGRAPPAKPAFFSPSQAEVIAAVRSLYADALEPFGRILLRRVRERYAQAKGLATEDVPLVDPRCVHQLCRSCSFLRVKPVDGNEVSVLLVDAPGSFVDVCSPLDPYPEKLWAAAAAYFESLSGEEVLLPGGRYACAQAIASRNLHFLAGRCLGQICHIVQLAVSQKKILGYIEGNMVPYAHSEESVKEQCAAWQQPFNSPSKQEACAYPVATWEEVRACLSAIIRNPCSAEPGVVTVSNVKRLFRSCFGLDLSETALGYSRLSELLQDTRLQDVCMLQVRRAGQFVICRPAKARSPQMAAGHCGSELWCSGPPCPWEPAAAPKAKEAQPAQLGLCSDSLRVTTGAAGHLEPQCLSTAPLRNRRAEPSSSAVDVAAHPPAADADSGRGAGLAAAFWAVAESSIEQDRHCLLSADVSPPPGLELPKLPSVSCGRRPPSEQLSPGPAARSPGELLSAQVRRLLELGEQEQRAMLWRLSRMDGRMGDALDARKEGRLRSSSASTSMGSEQTGDLDSTMDSEGSRFGTESDCKESHALCFGSYRGTQ